MIEDNFVSNVISMTGKEFMLHTIDAWCRSAEFYTEDVPAFEKKLDTIYVISFGDRKVITDEAWYRGGILEWMVIGG